MTHDLLQDIYARNCHDGPKVGLVIGTYASLPYVHLHLEAWKRNCPEIPVLVHDDASPAQRDLRALCADYGADFSTNPERFPTWIGDLSVFEAGFAWAQEHKIQLLVKMSRRFIPVYNWVPELQSLALRTQYATFTNHTTTPDFGFRTECVAMHVDSWLAVGAVGKISAQVALRRTPQVETFVHNLARTVQASSCLSNRKYELENPKMPRFGAYGDWDLLGTDRAVRLPYLLWHHSCDPVEYCRAALQYGITLYAPSEWREPNGYRPSALYGYAGELGTRDPSVILAPSRNGGTLLVRKNGAQRSPNPVPPAQDAK